jgi:Tol biopolymer transport system component
MRFKRLFLAFLGLIMIFISLSSMQQNAEQLYQAGLYAEEVEGDLQKAIQIYTQIIEKFGDKKEIAADAQLHIGLCYEKLGKTEAIKAYERVLKNYPGQGKQVAAARERLAALQTKEPSGQSSKKLLEGLMAALSMSLSPDGTKLAVLDLSKGQNIAAYDLSRKQLDLVTHYAWAKGGFVTYFGCWSPDGKEIVFFQNKMDPAGPGETVVSTLEGKARVIYRVEDLKAGYPVPYDWLAGGSAILTGLMHEDMSGILGLVPLSGGSFKALHNLRKSVEKFVQIADASPDGRFIVFQDRDSQGKHDLYIIGTDGTSLEILSDHPADERTPRWSPDGKHIVFLSQRHGSWALWGIAVNEGKSVGEPFFIKEGNQELLNWTNHGLAYREMLMLQDIFTASIDPDSLEIKGKPRQIEYTPTGGNVCPSWSPDGKYLAFGADIHPSGEKKIVVVSIEGGESKEFPNPDKNQQKGTLNDLCWLPDGSGLSLSGLDDGGKPTLFQLDLETGEWKIWPIPVRTWTRTEWSGDGKSFLYARHGFVHQDVTSDYHGDLDLSPDAEHIISTGVPNKFGYPTAMFMLSLTDGSARKLDLSFPEGKTLRSPTWSPDGRQIAFMVQSQKFEIHLMKNVITK